MAARVDPTAGPPWAVTRSTSSAGPLGTRTLTVQAADQFAAVQHVARQYADDGEGRIKRLPGGGHGVRRYRLMLRRRLEVRYTVQPA